jgi:RHS repeat-associated protein
VTQGDTVRRFTQLGGNLALTTRQDGQGEVTIANPHGDAVSFASVAGSTHPAVGIVGWADYDEYGNVRTAPQPAPVNYGWVGAKGRATSGAGLLLMGVRVYNPVTGIFTTPDPVPGGGANNYTYPTDPVNSFDLSGALSGRAWWGTCNTWTAWWSPYRHLSLHFSRAGTTRVRDDYFAYATFASIGTFFSGWVGAVFVLLATFATYIAANAWWAARHNRCLWVYVYNFKPSFALTSFWASSAGCPF